MMYIKGLMEGMELDASKKETKILNAMLDLLTDLANDVSDLNEDVSQIYDEIDAMDEDMDDLESYVFGEEDDEEEDDEEYEDGLFEITCPNCGEVVCVDEEMLTDENLACPNCASVSASAMSAAVTPPLAVRRQRQPDVVPAVDQDVRVVVRVLRGAGHGVRERHRRREVRRLALVDQRAVPVGPAGR